MIVLIKESGNHSNRLLQHIHFEAFCLEHKIRFLNPTFYDLEKHYNFRRNHVNGFCHFILKVIRKIDIQLPSLVFDSDYKNVVNLDDISKRKVLFVEGWYFRNHDLVKKYQVFFSKKYSLKYQFYKDNPLYNKILSLNKEQFTIIGVHIRRGDYKTFKSGIYCYDDEVFLNYMNDLRLLVNESLGKEVKFVIFSNDHHSFNDNEEILVSKNEWYIDHHLMSLCDYLIGPPSSFTLWASYVGNVPFYHVKQKNENIKFEDFLISDL